MRFLIIIFSVFLSINAYSQLQENNSAKIWADSVYNSLNNDERIGQVIVARLSIIDMKTMKITSLNDQVTDYVKRFNIGSVCIFQGSPVYQAGLINQLKKTAKTPILFSIDGEWGLGQRILDSVLPLPKQMMLGAVKDSSIIYQYGKVVAAQCKRMGIQMNYAPVMDVNNNPNNPIINDRSFGENKYKVASFGIQYMKGLQDNGVMACAKHFPGHGDVDVDSHLDLPIINKSFKQIDSLELYPFKKIFKQDVSSVMIAHLFIPSIDSTKNRPTSLSPIAIQELLRKKLEYKGLTITDGLEMQGVKKFYPNGESSVQSIIAGNDLLCLPDSIPMVVSKIKKAIEDKRLNWSDIELHCKRVLMAKYQYVLNNNDTININNLTAEINKDVPYMRKSIAENAITLLSKKDEAFFPLHHKHNQQKVIFVGIGINAENEFAKKMKLEYNADLFFVDYGRKNKDSLQVLLDSIKKSGKKVVIGIHQVNRAPAKNFSMSNESVAFVKKLQQQTTAITFLFGNAYAAKNWCDAKNLVVCYEDDAIVQQSAFELLKGDLHYKGTLPVTVCDSYKFGSGICN
jgi:beta-glucosidase-like glycosyl hydrolase